MTKGVVMKFPWLELLVIGYIDSVAFGVYQASWSWIFTELLSTSDSNSSQI